MVSRGPSSAAAAKVAALCSIAIAIAVASYPALVSGAAHGDKGKTGGRDRARADGECKSGDSKRDMFPLAYVDGTVGIKGLQGVTDSRPYAAEGKITAAKDFSIHYFSEFKLVQNKRNNHTYVLTQCGASKPSADDIASAIEGAGIPSDTIVRRFTIPLTNIAVEDTPPITMLADLGLYQRIAHVSMYASDSCSILHLGCRGTFNVSAEQTPEIDAIFKSDTPGDYTDEAKDMVIQFSASSDPGALARAEWHKFVGAFFNKELEAEKLYEQIADTFNAHVAKAEAIADGTAMKMAWCAHSPVSSWNPIARVVCSLGGRNQYKKDIIEGAGATVLTSDRGTDDDVSFMLDSETDITAMKEYLAQVDALVDDTSYWPGAPSDITLETFKEVYVLGDGDYPFLNNSMVLRADKAVALHEAGTDGEYWSSDWFQAGISRPDIAVEDIFGYLSPDAATPGRESHFFRNIATGELPKVTSDGSDCQAITCPKLTADLDEPICTLDIEFCGDGENFVKGNRRDPSKGCQYESDSCDFPGAKTKQPVECVDNKNVESDANLFPLIFDGSTISTADDIEDGTELPALPTMVEQADDFAIAYFNSYKVAVNKKMNEVYVLYQCGVFPPLVDEVQEVLKSDLGIDLSTESMAEAKLKYFSVPLQSVAVSTSIPASMMEDLGLHPRISYISQYTSSPCSQKVLECSGGTGFSYYSADLNDILANVDGVFNSDLPGGLYHPMDKDHLVIQVSASSDPGPLKRAEWHKFVGLFFNKELEAEALYEDIAAKYNAIKQDAMVAKGDGTGPKVAWCTYNAAASWNPVAGIDCHVGGRYQYKKDLVEAAGGVFLDSDEHSDGHMVSVKLVEGDAEAVTKIREFLKQADILIDETYINPSVTAFDNHTMAEMMELFQLTEADTEDFPFLKNKMVFRFDKAWGVTTDSLDWYQTGIGRPDMALKDLVSIITPSAIDASESFETHFFRNLATGELSKPMSPSECPEQSCSALQDDLEDNKICTLDVKFCEDSKTSLKRNPANNCNFPDCPIVTAPVGKSLSELTDESEVLVVKHELTMPDLTVEDFTDALQSLLVSNLAVAWSVPATNVEITSFKAGSLVVNAEVAVAEKSEALSAQDQDAAEAKLSGAFDADEFGTVTAVITKSELATKASVEDAREERAEDSDDDDEDDSAAAPMASALLLQAAAAFMCIAATLLF